MLSTKSWVNRSDVSDGLSALFGSNANQARLVRDRAILDWEEVIANFNYAGGGNNYNLTVVTAELTSIAKGGPMPFPRRILVAVTIAVSLQALPLQAQVMALAQHVQCACLIRAGFQLESHRHTRAGQRRTPMNFTTPKGNVP